MSKSLERRRLIAGALAGLAAVALRPPAEAAEPAKADHVLVVKSERRLYLLRNRATIRSYPIRLGPNPVGPKVFELDGRTPEGTYVIDRRTTNTPYHLALHISYPQQDNVARAGQYGLPAGGAIFIHGTPGSGRRFERDWTDGCIAVSNAAVDEIAHLVANGTPVEIRP